MAVNTGLASLSNGLFTTSIAVYALATAGYAAEYAFGRRGRVAATVTTKAVAENRAKAVSRATESADVQQKVLVPAGAGTADGLTADDLAAGPDDLDTAAEPEPSSDLPAEPPVTDPAERPARDRAESIGRLAVAVTVLGALLHLASVVVRGAAVDRVPWGNMYEFASVAGLIAVVAWLAVLAKSPALRFLGLFVMVPVVVVMFLAGTVLYAKASPLVPALQSYWLAIHVSAAASGEGMLMTSAVLAILYLAKSRYDRGASRWPRIPASLGERLPAAATLDKASYRIVAFAFPIYTFGVICGAIWAEAAWGRYWGWDPKETWAFVAWVIYAAYLHARATAGWKGRNAAWINVLGFAAMTFNFFVVNLVISGLHSYSGLN